MQIDGAAFRMGSYTLPDVRPTAHNRLGKFVPRRLFLHLRRQHIAGWSERIKVNVYLERRDD